QEDKEKVQKLYIKNDQGIDNVSGQTYCFYKVQLEGELNLSEFTNLNYLEIRGSSFSVELSASSEGKEVPEMLRVA
ncbi:621_t:CDS:2, partial [Ambispora leptoticha]